MAQDGWSLIPEKMLATKSCLWCGWRSWPTPQLYRRWYVMGANYKSSFWDNQTSNIVVKVTQVIGDLYQLPMHSNLSDWRTRRPLAHETCLMTSWWQLNTFYLKKPITQIHFHQNRLGSDRGHKIWSCRLYLISEEFVRLDENKRISEKLLYKYVYHSVEI